MRIPISNTQNNLKLEYTYGVIFDQLGWSFRDKLLYSGVKLKIIIHFAHNNV